MSVVVGSVVVLYSSVSVVGRLAYLLLWLFAVYVVSKPFWASRAKPQVSLVSIVGVVMVPVVVDGIAGSGVTVVGFWYKSALVVAPDW